MSENDPIIELIVSEEEDREQEKKEEPDKTTTEVIEMDSISRSNSFTPFSTTKTNTVGEVSSLPIDGSGEVSSILIIGDSENYSIRMTVDDTIVYNDEFLSLQRISPELVKVSAYKDGGDSIISITDYSFSEFFDLDIIPDSNMTFKKIRIEVEIDE